jgi:hypothetical protein
MRFRTSFVLADFYGLQGFYDVVNVYKTTGHHFAERWCCRAGGGGAAAKLNILNEFDFLRSINFQ